MSASAFSSTADRGSWQLALPGMIGYSLLMLLSLEQPFFWDGALHSKLAHWYLEHHFQSLIPPADLDTGHPPFFALFLAGAWKIFGRNLAVSHLLMLPFILGSIWQLASLVHRFLPAGRVQYLTLLLLLLEPTFMAQSTLVSADIVLVFFYLLGVSAILKDKRLLLVLAITGLGLVSLRGLFAIGALGITELLLIKCRLKTRPRNWLYILWPYVTGAGLIFCWYAYHQTQTGWWLSAPVSNWSEQRGLADLGLLLKNIAVVGWRLVDFGRLGIWLMLCTGLWLGFRFESQRDHSLKLVLLLAAIPLVIFAAGFVPFTNPIGHRYFMVVYLLVTVAAGKLASLFIPKRWLSSAFAMTAALLITGHFWVYPDSIAKGWDSSLAYWPYPKLQQEVDQYLASANIKSAQVGTTFPLRYGSHFTFLTAGNREFKEKDLHRDRYILQTNLSNEFSEAEQAELKQNWQLRKTFACRQVYLRLYARK